MNKPNKISKWLCFSMENIRLLTNFSLAYSYEGAGLYKRISDPTVFWRNICNCFWPIGSGSLTEKSFHRIFLTENSVDRTSFGRTSFYPKSSWPKRYLTVSSYRHGIFGKKYSNTEYSDFFKIPNYEYSNIRKIWFDIRIDVRIFFQVRIPNIRPI
jgi:hypothetical protein